MQINPETGFISLPGKIVFGPDLTLPSLIAANAWGAMRRPGPGTEGWCHYLLPNLRASDQAWGADLCFHQDVLVRVTLAANVHPDGQPAAEGFSPAAEAESKRFHDARLAECLGRPHKVRRFKLAGLGARERVLEECLLYRYPWGEVSSTYDPKGGCSQILVTYGDRFERAIKGPPRV